MINGHEDIITIDDYAEFVGEETIERVRKKAEKVSHLHITHVSSTYYGGGVAELLSSLTLLLNSVGVKCGWRVLQGSPDYFSVTKKMHNALQGGEINLTDRKKEIYEGVVHQNAIRNHLDHDVVIIHDPQPLPMIQHYEKRGPWIWHCHIDMSKLHWELWHYLKPVVEQYDTTIFSLEEYAQALDIPQVFLLPAIDPFVVTNKPLTDEEIQERLDYYDIPTDLPIVTQVSRFDRWKDPEGVIQAFKLAQNEIDATLVLLGNFAADDPEGEELYHSLLEYADDRILILAKEDTALVNALQSRSHVVLQKSIREGFGLTVTEAMWKGTPVIGGDVGGIRYQIKDGENGFLVSSIKEAADRMIQLVKDQELRERLGKEARKTVEEHFLLIRLLEQYLDLLAGFETTYDLTAPPKETEVAADG